MLACRKFPACAPGNQHRQPDAQKRPAVGQARSVTARATQQGDQEQLLRPNASQALLAWPSVAWPLLGGGATMGTLLDGIHSRTGLQVYDVAAVTVGGLHTSLAVPPLLAAFYLVLGLLHLAADSWQQADPVMQQAHRRASNIGYVAACFGMLAINLTASAYMYENQTPYPQISAALAVLAAANWKLFDGTKHGLLLAAVCALGAPACELLLLQVWQLWHYSRPDVLGFVSWVPWCYFLYTPAVANFARFLRAAAVQRQHGEGKQV